jgi:hypothetical protein
MTADPYKENGGASEPGSWNRYVYVRGQPTGRIDPEGLADFEVTGYCVGCAGNLLPSGLPGGGARGGFEMPHLMWDYSMGDYSSWSAGGGVPPPEETPEEKSRKAALALTCNADIRTAMRKSWAQSANGTTGVEAGFRLDQNGAGYSIVENAYTNEQRRQGLRINVSGPNRTTAIFHVHPNRSGPQPSMPSSAENGTGDTGVADKYGLDIFVMSKGGLWFYDHTLKKSINCKTTWTGQSPVRSE